MHQFVCAARAGIPFNYTITGCSSANGYNSFEAIFWRDQESGQGRPFQIDTTYSSDSEGLHIVSQAVSGVLAS